MLIRFVSAKSIMIRWLQSKAKRLFAHLPFAEGAGRSVESDTNLDDGKAVLPETDGIVLHVNLSQGFFGRLV